MRESEPCVPDRLEDRTPISCEWAEKEHTGWRAESKVEVHAPEVAFSRRGLRRSAVAEASSACEVACLDPFLFLSPNTSSSSARFRMRSWSARPNSVMRRRLPVSAFTFSTAPTHLPGNFSPGRLEAVDVPSFPAKGDSCSTAEVLSTAWNRCARGSLPLRSSTGPPTTRAPF